MTLRCIRVVLAVAALATARAAAAQSIDLPSARPSDTLFGSGPTGATQQLDVTLSVLGAYDTSLGDDLSNGIADPAVQVRGSFGGLGGGLNYSKKLRHGA